MNTSFASFADIGNDWFGNSGEDIYQAFKAASWPRDVIKLAFNIMMNTSSEEKATKAIIKKVAAADKFLNMIVVYPKNPIPVNHSL